MIVRVCDRFVEWGYKRIQFYLGVALGVDTAAVEIINLRLKR